MLKTQLARVLFRLVALLPLAVLRGLGMAIGWLLWRLNTRAARVTQTNIALCFDELDEASQHALVRESMLQTGITSLELIKVLLQPSARTARYFKQVEGEELVGRLRDEGRGVLMLVPHLGNWEAVGVWLGQRQKTVTALYQPPKQAFVEPIIKEAREKQGNLLYPTDTRGVRAVLKALKRGEAVAKG